MFLSS